MKNESVKLSILFTFFLLFSISIAAYSAIISTLSTGVSEQNVTFTGNQNVTKYINIPRYANYTNITINITGQGALGNPNISGLNCFNGSVPTVGMNLTECGMKLDGTAGYSGLFAPDGSDGITNTLYSGYGFWNLTNNVTTAPIWEFNLKSHPASTTINHSIQIHLYVNNWSMFGAFQAALREIGDAWVFGVYHGISGDSYAFYDGTEWRNSWIPFVLGEQILTVNYTGSGVGSPNISFYVNSTYIGSAPAVPLKRIRWMSKAFDGYAFELKASNVLVEPREPYMEFMEYDNDYEFLGTGLYNTTEEIILNTTRVNTLLDDGCNCTYCTLSTTLCTVPILTHSNSLGNVEYSDISFNYTYDIDNCTNYHTYAINYTILDELTNEPVSVDIGGAYNFSDGITTSKYEFIESQVENFSICINPDYGVFSTDYVVQYSSGSDYPERRYSIDNGQLDSNIQEITLYILNVSNGIYVRFRTIDTFNNPIVGVNIRMKRYIDGVLTTIESEVSDDSGLVTFFTDPDNDYIFDFTLSGYNIETKTIRPTSSEIYNVVMTSTSTADNPSLSSGLSYRFAPREVLNSSTWYNFYFNATQTIWDITNCTMRIEDRNSNILNTSVGKFTVNNCYVNLSVNTLDYDLIRSYGTIELNYSYNMTLDPSYAILNSSYKGNASLMNLLDDIRKFNTAGFDNFTLMVIAFIIIFSVTGLAASWVGITNQEGIIILFISLVWLFSYVRWLYFDSPTLPDFIGLKQYLIAILLTLMGIGFIIHKNYA